MISNSLAELPGFSGCSTCYPALLSEISSFRRLVRSHWKWGEASPSDRHSYCTKMLQNSVPTGQHVTNMSVYSTEAVGYPNKME